MTDPVIPSPLTQLGHAVGLPESPLENVLLEQVTIVAAQTGLELRHARGVEFRNVKVTAKNGAPFVVLDSQVRGLDVSR